MIDIKRLNEELEELIAEDTVLGLKLIPHGSNATKYIKKAIEYLKTNKDKVKVGFINIPLAELGEYDSKLSAGYEFRS